MMKIRKIGKKLVERMVISVAISDANSACPCITFQPKMPRNLKKMRKFKSTILKNCSCIIPSPCIKLMAYCGEKGAWRLG